MVKRKQSQAVTAGPATSECAAGAGNCWYHWFLHFYYYWRIYSCAIYTSVSHQCVLSFADMQCVTQKDWWTLLWMIEQLSVFKVGVYGSLCSKQEYRPLGGLRITGTESAGCRSWQAQVCCLSPGHVAQLQAPHHWPRAVFQPCGGSVCREDRPGTELFRLPHWTASWVSTIHILSYQPRADFTDNNECKTTPLENLYTANVSLTPVFSLLWRHLQKHWATVGCFGRILSVISSRDEIPVNTIGFTPSCTHRGQSTQTAFWSKFWGECSY